MAFISLVSIAGSCLGYPTNVAHWLPLDAGGWSVVTTSADSRVIHVSSSSGSDTTGNGSITNPYATIAKGKSYLRSGNPDWLLLKKGDVWYETLGQLRASGRSAAEPMVIGSYGAGPRPMLKTGAANAMSTSGAGGGPPNTSYLVVMGLSCYAHTRDPESPEFAGCAGGTGVSWLRGATNLLFEDCRFDSYVTGLVIQNTDGYGIFDVVIRRCVVVDSYSTNSHSQGIYTAGINGLLAEENVIDHCGWNELLPGAEATIFNHNYYIQTSCRIVTVRGNILTRSASHGCQLRPGGILADNLIVQCALAGFAAGHESECDYSYVTGNVIMEGRDITPATRRGFGIELLPARVLNTCEGNIIANKLPSVAGYAALTSYSATNGCGFAIRRNTIVNWRTGNGGQLVVQTPYRCAEVRNNIIQETASDSRLFTHSGPTGDVSFASQLYHGTRPSNEWFTLASTSYDLNGWSAQTGETDSRAFHVPFKDPTRSVASYHASLGGSNSFDAFIAACRAQSKDTWDTNYTASAVIAYLREGFRPMVDLGPEQIGAVWPPVPEPAMIALLTAVGFSRAGRARATHQERRGASAQC
ncbi:right-handed parallel beta-helix repeat-containing protein [bacterium]|nr:right-handed parallel beta-helix repeat-containing protein [bacterium]